MVWKSFTLKCLSEAAYAKSSNHLPPFQQHAFSLARNSLIFDQCNEWAYRQEQGIRSGVLVSTMFVKTKSSDRNSVIP
jgi:hypothetical protein